MAKVHICDEAPAVERSFLFHGFRKSDPFQDAIPQPFCVSLCQPEGCGKHARLVPAFLVAGIEAHFCRWFNGSAVSTALYYGD